MLGFKKRRIANIDDSNEYNFQKKVILVTVDYYFKFSHSLGKLKAFGLSIRRELADIE